MTNIRVIITTEPVAKGRPRVAIHNGKVRTYNPPKTVAAQDFIKSKLQRHIKNAFPPHTPVKMMATFYRTKSKGLPKRETLPFRKPDLDNLTKLLLDSLDHILVADDAQVTTFTVRKRWTPKASGYITIKLEEDKE